MRKNYPSRARIVLIDDDEVYNAIMRRTAERHGIQLDVFTSLLDLGGVSMLGHYDLAIVDYNLDYMTGLEIAEYLTVLFADLPMILISGGEPEPALSAWPKSVVAFIPKRSGHLHVIEAAARLVAHPAEAVHHAENDI